jgi:hypothetical protein
MNGAFLRISMARRVRRAIGRIVLGLRRCRLIVRMLGRIRVRHGLRLRSLARWGGETEKSSLASLDCCPRQTCLICNWRHTAGSLSGTPEHLRKKVSMILMNNKSDTECSGRDDSMSSIGSSYSTQFWAQADAVSCLLALLSLKAYFQTIPVWPWRSR